MPSGRRVFKGVVTGVAFSAVAFVVADVLRPLPGPARLLDWDEIRDRAKDRLPGDLLNPRTRRRLEDHYARLATEVEGPLLAAVGGLPKGATLPPFQALDRHSWVDLNVAILADAMEPILAVQSRLPNTRLLGLGRTAMDQYVGVLLSFLGRRVLGQYDPQLLGREPAVTPGLYLVEPNIADWEEEAELPAEPLRRWLILHELTHAWQFTAHPWLRDHLNGMLQEVLGAALVDGQGTLERVLTMTIGMGRQLSVLGKVQATMSLVEGYSNLVMDEVGRKELPEFERLEAAHRARTNEKSIFERLFWRLTGLELKLQQYVVGEQFSRAIHDRYGMPALNRAWEGPESLPTMEELRDPERWARRMGLPDPALIENTNGARQGAGKARSGGRQRR